MSPTERGVSLAETFPPLTDEQVEAAARIFAASDDEAVAA